jgi:hypothetical protein
VGDTVAENSAHVGRDQYVGCDVRIVFCDADFSEYLYAEIF